MVVLSAILSFFFASYTVLFQNVLKFFEIDIKNIGMLNAIYYIVSIALSYGAGYIAVKNVRKISLAVLGMGLVASVLCLLNYKWFVIPYLLIVYPIIGAGYNTVVQIYFQNETARDDIPILKGIYNIVCGASIFLSGVLMPLLLLNLSIFFVVMSLIFVCSIIYLYVAKI